VILRHCRRTETRNPSTSSRVLYSRTIPNPGAIPAKVRKETIHTTTTSISREEGGTGKTALLGTNIIGPPP